MTREEYWKSLPAVERVRLVWAQLGSRLGAREQVKVAFLPLSERSRNYFDRRMSPGGPYEFNAIELQWLENHFTENFPEIVRNAQILAHADALEADAPA